MASKCSRLSPTGSIVLVARGADGVRRVLLEPLARREHARSAAAGSAGSRAASSGRFWQSRRVSTNSPRLRRRGAVAVIARREHARLAEQPRAAGCSPGSVTRAKPAPGGRRHAVERRELGVDERLWLVEEVPVVAVAAEDQIVDDRAASPASSPRPASA